MSKGKAHHEFWAEIQLPLEPVTILGLLAEDLLGALASGLPPSPPAGSSTSDLRADSPNSQGTPKGATIKQ